MTTPTPTPFVEQRNRFVDMKITITWLISAAASVVLALGGVYLKLDNVSNTVSELKVKTDIRDERISEVRSSIEQIKGANDVQNVTLTRHTQDIVDLRRDIDDIRKNQRWMPK